MERPAKLRTVFLNGGFQAILRRTNMQVQLRSRRFLLPLAAGATLLALAALLLNLHMGSTRLSKDEAISIALQRYSVKPARVAAKLMRRADLLRAEPQLGSPVSGQIGDLVWVVAISGDFGVESTMVSLPNTWGVAVIPDKTGTVQLWINGSEANSPSFFDQLQDLSHR